MARPVLPRRSELGPIERAAWWLPLSSRRFFLTLALTTAGLVLASSLAAAAVAADNSTTIRDTRDRSLEVAKSITEFRTHLDAANTQVATTLVSGRQTDVERTRFESELFEAGLALTQAGVVATGESAIDIEALAGEPVDAPDESADDIEALADEPDASSRRPPGLGRYADLVDTARVFPVGSFYSDFAGKVLSDDPDGLIPTAERVRETTERELIQATDRVAGRARLVVVVALGVAMFALVASAVLVAGRTRRLLHPGLVGAVIALAVGLAMFNSAVWSQRGELRAAANDEIVAYVTANDAAFRLFDLRADEMAAVASHRGGGETSDDDASCGLPSGDSTVFADVIKDADEILERLDDTPIEVSLRPALRRYTDGLAAIGPCVDAALDAGDSGDYGVAAGLTLQGDSATAYADARVVATSTVERRAGDLQRRLDDAAAADVEPSVLALLGVAAAGLTAAAILHRGHHYR